MVAARYLCYPTYLSLRFCNENLTLSLVIFQMKAHTKNLYPSKTQFVIGSDFGTVVQNLLGYNIKNSLNILLTTEL